jgi:hypothetical protein
MKVTIQPATGAAFVLADGTADRSGTVGPGGLTVDVSRTSQIDDVIRGFTRLVRARQNRLTTVTFEVNRLHKNVSDAERFCLDHDADVPENGTLTAVTDKDGTPATRVMEQCEVQDVSCRMTGATTWVAYRIVGGAFKKK